MPTFLRFVTTALLLSYPLLVWWLAQQGFMRELLYVLAAILLIQALSLGVKNPRSYLALSALVVVLLVAWFTDPLTGVLYYPVWMNISLLVLFSISLIHPPAVVTRLAILMEGELSPAAVRYTERVTLTWALFFAINGGIAWWTVYLGDMDLWALYNGFIAYLLMALLMSVEWSIRRVVKKRH